MLKKVMDLRAMMSKGLEAEIKRIPGEVNDSLGIFPY